MVRLKDRYRKEVIPRLMEICGYKNIMQVPRLEKIVLNIGMGEAISNAKSLESAEADLAAIAGQHVLTTRSKKSIANFKLRMGMPVGLKVTLRGERMWIFFDKLVNAVLPHMLERGKGQIVNLGSIFGSIGFPCFASYSASKFALRGFSEALRRELAGTGIGVSYVAPRFTRTAFNRSAVTRMANALKMNQDEPESVAASVITAIERDDRERYLGWPEKLFVRLNSILPRLVDPNLIKQADLMRPFATESNR